MPKKRPNPEMVDDNNPEWTQDDFKRAVPLSGLPKEMQQVLSRRGKRGPQKSPTKELVSIRLSREVIEHFKAGGPGWQARIDEVLKAEIRKAG